MNLTRVNTVALSTFLFLSSFACQDDDGIDRGDRVEVPAQLTVNAENFVPEDVFVYKSTVYVSGFGNGTIQKFDVTKKDPVAEEIIQADATHPSRWGIAVDEGRQTLLNIANVAYGFDGNVSGSAKVVAYNLSDYREVASWTLPEATVGNSIVVANGYYYISDIGPNTRIIRLDPATGETIIKTDPALPSNGFGFGNLIVANDGLYGAVNNKMWYIALSGDGSFGEVSEVIGVDNVFSDGMTYAGNNTFYYAENDALNPENVGKVYKVTLTSTTEGTAALESNVTNNGSLNNPSGVFYASFNAKNYLFVNESQLFNQDASAPFKINVFEIN